MLVPNELLIQSGRTEVSLMGVSTVKVSRMFIYPVKSAGGIPAVSANVGLRGFEYDRRFMVVDEEGVFLSQRKLPRMALIFPRVNGETLKLGAPGMPDISIPPKPEGVERLTVSIWRDLVDTVAVSEEADRWLGELLGVPCRLVYQPEWSRRMVDPGYGLSGDEVSLADGFPFLLLSEKSLEDLNSRLGEPVPVDRFRPSIVVEGCEAYAEDGWRRLRIGEVEFRVVKPCSRCAIVTVDQASGEHGKEPLHTLSTYRRSGEKVLFGQNMIPNSSGTLRAGAWVEIVA